MALSPTRPIRNQTWAARLPRLTLLVLLVSAPPFFVSSVANANVVKRSVSPSSPVNPPNLLSAPPRNWIVDVAANEIRAIKHPDSYLRYRIRTIDAKGDRVRDTVESRDGPVARLILKDGRPLSQEEDRAERDRLNEMISSPSEFAKHIRSDQSGKKLAIELISFMPDAMLYTYTPGQPQIEHPGSTRQIVIEYAPNPIWSPPSTSAEALTGLSGRMWIDAKTRHLLRMEGTVFRAVNVGWGMLAHVYPGGKVALDQTTIGGNRLIFTRFVEQVTVRALMVKTLRENATIEASAFQPLPGPLSYQDAIRILLATPPPSN